MSQTALAVTQSSDPLDLAAVIRLSVAAGNVGQIVFFKVGSRVFSVTYCHGQFGLKVRNSDPPEYPIAQGAKVTPTQIAEWLIQEAKKGG